MAGVTIVEAARSTLGRHPTVAAGPVLVREDTEVIMGLGIIGLIGAIVVAVIILRFAGIL